MASGADLKIIAKRRIKTARILLDQDEWDMAAYILAYALECALKSVICKTLRLVQYPQGKHGDQAHFLSHHFDVLLRLSGMEYLFGAQAVDNFLVWSEFTKEFPGKDWTKMRYEINTQFDKNKVELLYGCLVSATVERKGIFWLLDKKRKW